MIFGDFGDFATPIGADVRAGWQLTLTFFEAEAGAGADVSAGRLLTLTFLRFLWKAMDFDVF